MPPLNRVNTENKNGQNGLQAQSQRKDLPSFDEVATMWLQGTSEVRGRASPLSEGRAAAWASAAGG